MKRIDFLPGDNPEDPRTIESETIHFTGDSRDEKMVYHNETCLAMKKMNTLKAAVIPRQQLRHYVMSRSFQRGLALLE